MMFLSKEHPGEVFLVVCDTLWPRIPSLPLRSTMMVRLAALALCAAQAAAFAAPAAFAPVVLPARPALQVCARPAPQLVRGVAFF